MQPLRNIKELLNNGRVQEHSGNWAEAADLYRRILAAAPDNRDAVKRLIMIYRRQKDFKNELSVITAALHAVADKDQSSQGKWLSANPQAAKAGKTLLRSLGGNSVTAYGTDGFVQQLLKRKELVVKKLAGLNSSAMKQPTKPAGTKIKNSSPYTPPRSTGQKKQTPNRSESEQAAIKKIKQQSAKREAVRVAAIKKKREEAAARKKEVQKKKEAAALAAALARQEIKEQKNAAKAAARAEKQKLEEASAAGVPSFFVISLRYLSPITKIDDAMPGHIHFLDKYFSKDIFIMAGRQVPRTGGIIIARAKDRKSVNRIMQQDPFVKRKLASFDVVEFKASRPMKRLPTEMA